MSNDPEKSDKKFSTEKIKNILADLNGKSNFSDKVKNYLGGFFEGISLKYVLTVAGGVLFFIVLILGVLIFAEPETIISLEKNISSTPAKTESVAEKRIHIKINAGMSTGEIADQLESKGVITSSLKFRILSRIRF